MVKHLLQVYHCDLHAKDEVSSVVIFGATEKEWSAALHLCVCGLYGTNVQLGFALLHDAVSGGSVELVKWLVEEKGLDVHEWNKVFCKPSTFLVCKKGGYHKY